MKITKTDKDASRLAAKKAAANEGCDVCPCCGENRKMSECISAGSKKQGIDHCGVTVWTTGLIFTKNMAKDRYCCLSCGAEWESDAYEE